MEIEKVEALAIAKLELSPGDVLVVRSCNRIPREAMNRIAEHIQPHLPEGVKVLVLDTSLTLSKLTAAEIAERTSS